MNLTRDFRIASRTLLQNPGFFGLAVATLGIGIAANTAIFSLFYQVVLRSLPVRDPQSLVVFHAEDFGMPGYSSSDNYENVFSYPLYRGVTDGLKSFAGVAARSSAQGEMTVDGSSERVATEIVSGNFFDVLGVTPAAGRLIQAPDDQLGHPRAVAVLSFDYWKKRFGARPSVLNQSIALNGSAFTVVGVAPPGFRGLLSGDSPNLFVPISTRGLLDPTWAAYNQPDRSWLTIVGRLRPGIPLSQAEAELAPRFASVVQSEMTEMKITRPNSRRRLAQGKRLELRSASRGLNQLERTWRKPLLVLACMVAVLLLIGCANLANLLLARGMRRSHDVAVRLALGARGWDITSMLLAESLIVALVGALAGLLAAPWITASILSVLPSDSLAGWVSGHISLPVYAFCALLMVAAGVASGLAPAWQSTHARPSGLLGDRSGSGGRLSARLRKSLIVGQLALSLILLTTAALFGKSLLSLMSEDLGFRADRLITFSVDPGARGYDGARGLSFYRQLTARLSALPGVRLVSMAAFSPLSNSDSSSNISIEGYTPSEGEDMNADTNAVGAAFFQTLGSRLLAGREFSASDTAASAKMAVVNEAFVKRFRPHASPNQAVGKLMEVGAGGKLDLTIVGVVSDIRNRSLRDRVRPGYYLPFEQAPSDGSRIRAASFLVRTTDGEKPFETSARAILAQLDRGLPLYKLSTMHELVQNSIYTDRLLAALTTAFAVLAALLTAIGLYGVVAYVVAGRTAEIGLRMAIGATQGNVFRMVLSEVGRLVASGVLLGVAGAWAAARAVRSQLFASQGLDAGLLLAALAILAAVAFVAGAGPAWRAARTEPLQALRHQ